MTKVYIVAGDPDYRRMFEKLGFQVTSDILKASLVCFTGGADVSPEYYGDKAHQYTYNSPQRDAVEARVFDKCVELGIPMVGVCRGGQFLNVMNGGRMYQHVENHTRSHYITDVDTGEVVYVSSTHHQMMMPSDNAQLVAFSQEAGRREWYDGEVAMSDISQKDVEVVYYENTRSLCFQPHPEFDLPQYEGMLSYFGQLLERLEIVKNHRVACGC